MEQQIAILKMMVEELISEGHIMEAEQLAIEIAQMEANNLQLA